MERSFHKVISQRHSDIIGSLLNDVVAKSLHNFINQNVTSRQCHYNVILFAGLTVFNVQSSM